ncbi:TadE family protein [Allopontixanthobacter sp.]|uniref:TadE/TadG family type IV pilus assembly protein n=1 Tax=Allopontixanthobacter sp. TaxID=2906452 RepID=UPI002ABBF64F|nr:TadE family protein [Allopontixanthobacter sp.]MDZ4306456.1 TadE family protein [Allopontixanthobacter sp.]
MTNRKNFRHLIGDRSGAIAIEFALLGPLLITMMFGVFQTGIYLQNYNAVRSLTSDAGRLVMIEFQKGNDMANQDIQSVVRGVGVNAPYLLNPDLLEVTTTTEPVSRVTGAKEITVRIAYTPNDVLPFIDLPDTTISYSRPIFVVDADGDTGDLIEP